MVIISVSRAVELIVYPRRYYLGYNSATARASIHAASLVGHDDHSPRGRAQVCTVGSSRSQLVVIRVYVHVGSLDVPYKGVNVLFPELRMQVTHLNRKIVNGSIICTDTIDSSCIRNLQDRFYH